MFEDIRDFLEQCVNEDAEAAVLHFEQITGVAHDILYVDDIEYIDGESEDDGIEALITFVFQNERGSNVNDDYVTQVEVTYWIDGDNLDASSSPEDIANELVDAFRSEGAIEASTTIQASTPIMAAGEDEGFEEPDVPDFGEDMFAENADDGNIEDQLDELSDSVEDIQDTVDDVEEDDVEIKINNNIEDHYIAECDSCQGIFISSVIKSDQYIDKISGVCPLCNKETDQYLKWVVTAVEQT